jgi:hypothetical protein
LLSLSARVAIPTAILIASSTSASGLYSNTFDGQTVGALNGQSAFVPGFPAVSWTANGDVAVTDGTQGPQPYSGYSVNLRSAAAASTNRAAFFGAEGLWISRPAGEDTVVCAVRMRIAPNVVNQTAQFGAFAGTATGAVGAGFRVSALDGSVSFVRGDSATLTDAVAAIGQWNEFVITWDTVTEATSLSMNGTVIASGITGITADFRRFAMTSASGNGGAATATFDDYAIGSIPAPGAAIAMLICGPASVAGRRRRR